MDFRKEICDMRKWFVGNWMVIERSSVIPIPVSSEMYLRTSIVRLVAGLHNLAFNTDRKELLERWSVLQKFLATTSWPKWKIESFDKFHKRVVILVHLSTFWKILKRVYYANYTDNRNIDPEGHASGARIHLLVRYVIRR